MTTTTVEHGVSFKDEMVRAIINGAKTQTRRILHVEDPPRHCTGWIVANVSKSLGMADLVAKAMRPGDFGASQTGLRAKYGGVGGRLYVKEAWAETHGVAPYLYRASGDHAPRWSSGMFMPKRVARIWMTVIDLRLERLSQITDEDALAEGIGGIDIGSSPRRAFMALFKSIHDKKPGDDVVAADPLLWVYSFNVEVNRG